MTGAYHGVYQCMSLLEVELSFFIMSESYCWIVEEIECKGLFIMFFCCLRDVIYLNILRLF